MHEVFPRLSKSKGSIRSEAPNLGEHTIKILKELNINKVLLCGNTINNSNNYFEINIIPLYGPGMAPFISN